MSRVITLLTDFGTQDPYVAEVKGRLLEYAPEATLVDLTHQIPPGDIQAGAYTLGRAFSAFPLDTVHLAVVDPGVGTSRRAIAAAARGHFFVAPDNGLLSEVLAVGAFVMELPVPLDASPTFHGRDVFALAAGRLFRGEELVSLGPAVLDPVRLPTPRLERRGDRWIGTVVHVDRFGTLVTNIPGSRVEPGTAVRVGAYDVEMKKTFGDVPSGETVAFIGSGGTIEIAVRDGRADSILGLARGAEVRAKAVPSREARSEGEPE